LTVDYLFGGRRLSDTLGQAAAASAAALRPPERPLRGRGRRSGRQTTRAAEAAAAVDKYIRARARHPQAPSPWLSLGVQGHDTARMTDSGIRDMVGRRGEHAGIQNVHPHRFRRSFADDWLAASQMPTNDVSGSVASIIHARPTPHPVLVDGPSRVVSPQL